jgi:SAM-dependent methyltransferase
MAVGSLGHLVNANPISAAVVRIFGTTDPHSHFRTRPLFAWARGARRRGFRTIVEIGCGQGANRFELARIMPEGVVYFGFDLSRPSIDGAIAIARQAGLKNFHFHCQDCSRFQFDRKPDLVLLIDVLEHLPDATIFLRDLRGTMSSAAIVLISVPTPLYPKVFGRKFHERVGHVVDGYDARSLSTMLADAGFAVERCQYNTGAIASVMAYLYYNVFGEMTGKLKSLAGVAFGSLKSADFLATPRMSCSLFAIAVPADVEHSSGGRVSVDA